MAQAQASENQALAGPRWPIISALGVVQIFAWGSSYYLLAVLAAPIAVDTGWPLAWIFFISNTPVDISAAIACTAKYMDWNGFWLIQRCFTVVVQLQSPSDSTRTPHQKAEGSLKKV